MGGGVSTTGSSRVAIAYRDEIAQHMVNGDYHLAFTKAAQDQQNAVLEQIQKPGLSAADTRDAVRSIVTGQLKALDAAVNLGLIGRGGLGHLSTHQAVLETARDLDRIAEMLIIKEKRP